jgi:hypothetical protein
MPDMQPNGQTETAAALIKGGSAWTFVGITSWSDAASIAALLYTLMLISEWIWKRGGKVAAQATFQRAADFVGLLRYLWRESRARRVRK